MDKILEVKGLCWQSDGREILHGVDFYMRAGKNTVLIGSNGAGKSTIGRAVAGIIEHGGEIVFDGKDISKLLPEERARLGIHISYQEPVDIPGLSLSSVIRGALEARGQHIKLNEFKLQLSKNLQKVELSSFDANRDFNVGFSGGEKKKVELLQILMLRPKLVILDELDSGLDVKAAKLASEILRDYQAETGASFLIITHNRHILRELNVDEVLALNEGRISKRGGAELLSEDAKDDSKSVQNS